MQKIIIVYGPTASGKTSYAVKLAHTLENPVIINIDSMQIYKELPIITAQPTDAEREGIEHLLFGYKSALEHSSLGIFMRECVPIISQALAENKQPILVGGTGMYINTLLNGYNEIPEISKATKDKVANLTLADLKQISPNLPDADNQRLTRNAEVYIETGNHIEHYQSQPNKRFFQADMFEGHFINKDRELNYQNANQRFDIMLEQGVLDEIKNLLNIVIPAKAGISGIDLREIPAFAGMTRHGNNPALKGHGIPELISYLNGEITIQEATEQAKRNTRRYIKRQLTFWRGQLQNDPRWKIINL